MLVVFVGAAVLMVSGKLGSGGGGGQSLTIKLPTAK